MIAHNFIKSFARNRVRPSVRPSVHSQLLFSSVHVAIIITIQFNSFNYFSQFIIYLSLLLLLAALHNVVDACRSWATKNRK